MKFIALLFATFFSLNAQAQLVDGAKLKSWSDAVERISEGRASGGDAVDAGLFSGYVFAIADTQLGGVFCVPPNATGGQLSAVTTKFLKGNPDKWNWRANWVVALALAEAFPCPKKDPAPR